jgi:hypothetical protein
MLQRLFFDPDVQSRRAADRDLLYGDASAPRSSGCPVHRKPGTGDRPDLFGIFVKACLSQTI